jgi:hypothetical protein
LIEAECATFLKHFASAERSFSLSVERASASGATHIEALAWERWAHCHLTRGDLDVAYEKLRIAHNLYAKWGEISSVDVLILYEKKYYQNANYFSSWILRCVSKVRINAKKVQGSTDLK